MSIAKISETKYSKPKFSITYIVSLVLKDQPLTKDEIHTEIAHRFPYFKNQSQDWKKSVQEVLMQSDFFVPKKLKGCDSAKWSISEHDYQKLHDEEFRNLQNLNNIPKQKKRGRKPLKNAVRKKKPKRI